MNDTTLETLQKYIRQFNRQEVANLIQSGALSETTADKDAIILSIVGLRSIPCIDALIKQGISLTPAMLQLDFDNLQNQDFIRQVLKKYKKQFDLQNEETCIRLFQLACDVNDADTIQSLVKAQKASTQYGQLASASASLFKVLTTISPSSLDENQKVDILYQAALSEDFNNRLLHLKRLGYSAATQNEKGETAASLLEARLRQHNYGKNRRSEVLRSKDRNALSLLNKLDTLSASADKSGNAKKRIFIGIIAAVVLIAVIVIVAIVATKQNNDSDSVIDDTVGTEISLTTDDTDAVDYNTDTEQVVENGDVVNIDYVGYMDDVAFSGGDTQGQGASLEIGSGSYIDDFEEQLIGHNVGEDVTVIVDFPDPYPNNPDYAGKEARFEVHINGIY